MHIPKAKLANTGTIIKEYLRELFPIIGWLPHYNRRWLVNDLSAGLTIGVMLVPQGIAYARLAGLPAEYGLYSALVGVSIYAIFGTSKDISVGPTSVLAMYIGQGIREVAKHHGIEQDNSHLAALASAMALLIGCMVAVMGILRLGIIIDFISTPVVVGFTFGAAVDIMVAQLPKLFGVPKVDSTHAAYATFWDMLRKFGRVSLPNLAVGISAVIMLILLQMVKTKFGQRWKFANTLATARVPIVVVFYTLVSFLVAVGGQGDDPDTGRKHPLNILRNVPRGIPQPQLPPLTTSILQKLFLASLLPLLQTVVEHVTISKALGRIGHYHTNNSQELLALGASNIATSFFSGFCGTGAMTRGMVLSQSGVRSPLSGLFASLVVCCALIFLPPAFYYIPDACLAAVIVTSVFRLMRGPKTFIKLWRINPLDSVSCFAALIFTVLFNIAVGIGVAVALTLIIILYKIARPDCIFLEPRADNPHIYVDPALPDVKTTPAPRGIIVFRPEEALIFPNAHYIRQTILHAINKRCASGRPPIDPRDDLWCNAGKHSNRHHISTTTTTSSTTTSFFQRLFRRGRRHSPINPNSNSHAEIREINPFNNDIITSESTGNNYSKSEVSSHYHTTGSSTSTNIITNTDTTKKSSPDDKQQASSSELPAIRALIIDCGAMSHIDASGLQMLLDVKAELIDFVGGSDHPFEMHFVNVKRQVLGVLEHSGIAGTTVPGLDAYEESSTFNKLDHNNGTNGYNTNIGGDLRQMEGQSAFTYGAHANTSGIMHRMSMSPLVNGRNRFVHYSVADAVHAVQRVNHTSST
ncbi:sulfate transporter family-domain-containing protein [Syncephalis plumigaleata]|nr:sulfate transporter family-domain-containing protein [Syncephalis plumigaleata]